MSRDLGTAFGSVLEMLPKHRALAQNALDSLNRLRDGSPDLPEEIAAPIRQAIAEHHRVCNTAEALDAAIRGYVKLSMEAALLGEKAISPFLTEIQEGHER